MGWHVERDGAQVHLAVGVDERVDEEDARAAGAALHQTAQSEYDGAFVFLHHLIPLPDEGFVAVLASPWKESSEVETNWTSDGLQLVS